MKTISKIFGLILAVAIGFSSCSSDDDDGPTPVQQDKDTTFVYTAVIKGFAPTNGGKTEYNLNDITLAQILGETNAKNFLGGEFQYTGSYLEVSGLKNMKTLPSLENLTIQVNSNTPVNFGTCKSEGSIGNKEFSSDIQQSGNDYVKFIEPIFNSVIGKSRKATLKISFTPTKDIVESDKVTLKISIRGKYKYNLYPTPR